MSTTTDMTKRAADITVGSIVQDSESYDRIRVDWVANHSGRVYFSGWLLATHVPVQRRWVADDRVTLVYSTDVATVHVPVEVQVELAAWADTYSTDTPESDAREYLPEVVRYAVHQQLSLMACGAELAGAK